MNKVTCTCGLRIRSRAHLHQICVPATTRLATSICGQRALQVHHSTMFQVHIPAALVTNYALTQWCHGAPPRLAPRRLHQQQVTTTHPQLLCDRNPWVHHQDLQILQHNEPITCPDRRPVSWVCSRRNSKVSQRSSPLRRGACVELLQRVLCVVVSQRKVWVPPKSLGGHHVEAADEHMSQLLQHMPKLDFAQITLCAPLCKCKTRRGSAYGVWFYRSFCKLCARVT